MNLIMLTALIGAIALALAFYVWVYKYLQLNGVRAEIKRRLVKLKTDVPNVKRPEPRKVTLSLAEIPLLDRTLKPLLHAIRDQLLKFAPQDISAMLEERITLAGKTGEWSVNFCVIVWLASIVVCVAIALTIGFEYELIWIQQIVVLLIGAVVGAMLPFFVLNRIIYKRQRLIRRQLPEFLDLLCVSVQAGLSLEGSMSKITDRMKGPLIDECKHMQRDTQMGIPRYLALQQMSKRCDIEEVYLFTASVIQSERLGTSMARTLSMQSENMRERHRQYVKAQALKAPVKIVFPLAIFILPAIFIVILLPTVMTMVRNLGS